LCLVGGVGGILIRALLVIAAMVLAYCLLGGRRVTLYAGAQTLQSVSDFHRVKV
jgi:protein tyrosine phosphatase (PTP) superfamily phosphohydrolase (DUF442 family)